MERNHRRPRDGRSSATRASRPARTGRAHTIEEEREPNFARGQSGEPVPGTEEHGDFATGQEHPPDTKVERRFSEGQEESPTSR